ncbi:hypothetical protein L6R53_24740 [Myxococcota bacterium]|nr:hypothetical protein [Myxococcota bacterium]
MTTHRSSSRSGTYSVVMVLTLPALMGVGAVAVDLSYQKVVWAELEAAADISATAGAQYLDGTVEGVDRAIAGAIRAAARNTAAGQPVLIQAQDIRTGYWDLTTGDFVEATDPALIDALQVTAWRGDVTASFAAVAFQDKETEATGDSLARNPAPEPAGAVSCYIPLAVPLCIFDKYDRDELVDVQLVLNPAGVDNVGWGRVAESPNASWIKDQIADCKHDGVARVGDDVGLQNGEVISAVQEVKEAIRTSTTTWDAEAWGPQPERWSQSALTASQYGQTWEGPLLVFDGGPEYCEGMGGGFNGVEELVGFAWAVVYDVKTAGGAADKNIRVKLDLMAEQEIGLGGGGLVDAGVDYDEPTHLIR